MNRVQHSRIFILSCILLLCPAITSTTPSQEQDKAEEFVGEGIIVGFQKGRRCPTCRAARGIGTFAEYWIVRIDNWIEDWSRSEMYILVQYNVNGHGVSDAEINSYKLRFTLRKRRSGEATDCRGVIISKDPYQKRPGELSDYERTKFGRLEEISPLQDLPCFIADHPPIVVK